MRANPADLGARPIVNAPFWESPDIFILAGVDPSLAPDVPPALGQVALAGAPNTLDAHVSRLRGRLTEAGACVAIHTVRGVGYLLDRA